MRQENAQRISDEELGKRLATVRRDRNLSQEEVAKHLGVSRPTMVAIEKGTRPVKPAELTALAQLYNRSVHQLLNQREYVTGFSPKFRLTQGSGISDEAVQNAVEEFRKLCEDYLRLEDLLGAPMPRHAYPEPYPTEGLPPQTAAEEIAQLERSRLSLGQGPLSNLLETMESGLGLRVFIHPIEEFRIAGMFIFSDRLGGCILVNGNHPRTRRNWSLAHECAHFLTDRYQEEITVLFEYERRPRSERFADAFSASFLMPALGLRQRFRKVVQSKKDFTVSDLCLLADQYDVSAEAMTHRLESLGCIRSGVWDQISAQGFESRRIQDRVVSRPRRGTRLRLPKRYVRLAVQAFEDEMITETELARLLRRSRVEAREIVESLTRQDEVSAGGEPYQLLFNFAETIPLESSEKEP